MLFVFAAAPHRKQVLEEIEGGEGDSGKECVSPFHSTFALNRSVFGWQYTSEIHVGDVKSVWAPVH